jgi:hypothetical protein
VNTSSDGTASYLWHLAGDVGTQTLKAYAINSQNQKVDSATATATGIASGSGWQSSSCSLQGGATVLSFCKLSTGRIFACYEEKSFVRYSNDNGATWYNLTSLGNTHNFIWMMSSAAGELFAFATGEGTLYSKDGGLTWTQSAVVPFSSVTSGISTPDGKLVVTNQSDVYVSTDKGQTWVTTPYSAFISPNSIGGDTNFLSPAEDQAGNLYVVGLESETIYQSKDGGNTWSPFQAATGNTMALDCSFYIDANNWFYKASSNPTNGGLFISKDQGATYTQLVNTSNTFYYLFSVQSDGNYYYENPSTGLFQSNGISSSVKFIQPISLPVPAPYIVAQNGNVVMGADGGEYIIYFSK